jgi:cob(I)alamin adenosyltransferase
MPLVEFHNIDSKMFWELLKDFDLVLFDNVDIEVLGKFKVINYLQNRDVGQEVVFTVSNKKFFDEIKDYFSLASSYVCKSKKNLMTSNITAVTGNGKGKSTYGFGFLLRNYINKKDVKLIYFDKGGNFYGERNFFDALKIWSLNNNLYGKFDYVATGLQRFDGKRFRFENNEHDLVEAREGLMLLKTALLKKTLVIADELNTVVKTGLVKLDDVKDVLSSVQGDLMMTGRYLEKDISDLSSLVVEVEEIKHYVTQGKGVRKGIDF